MYPQQVKKKTLLEEKCCTAHTAKLCTAGGSVKRNSVHRWWFCET